METCERVVVALTGAPGGDVLIRRAARMARRAQGDLLGVHVRPSDGLASQPSELLQKHRRLLADVGGSYHELAADDVATGLVQFARAERATQLVLGSSRQSRWAHLLRGSVISKVLRQVRDLDVHVISTDATEDEHGVPFAFRGGAERDLSPSPHDRGRCRGGALPLLTLALAALRSDLSLPAVLLLYLMVVVAVAAIGGFVPALLAGVAAFLLAQLLLHPADPHVHG